MSQSRIAPSRAGMTELSRIELRRATQADAELFFAWRNHPEIVELSTSRVEVTWAEHQEWLRRTLATASARVFVVAVDGIPAGQVRFSSTDVGDCAVSIYLLPPFPGRGLGVRVLGEACERAFHELDVTRVLAFIRDDNLRSIKAFRKAGFADAVVAHCPPAHVVMALTRGG
jgi:RimJ/RimL family protein N-acetyltransferase